MSGKRLRVWREGLLLAIITALSIATIALGQADGTARAMNDRGVTGPSNGASTPNNPAVTGSRGSDYVIGVGDLLSINVLNDSDVTGKVPVRPDGMITVPLIGDIQASGLTPDVLQATITKKLTEYVKQPSVTVIVEEMNSRQFNVLGKVQHPGSFPLNKPTTVLDALAQAGGFTEFARTNKIYVLRRDASGSTTKLPFNYKRVAQGASDQDNEQLQAGDTVIVP